MANKEDIEVVREDVKRYSSLEAVQNSGGGKLIVKTLKKDAVNAIDTLISTYKSAPDIELRSTCADLNKSINLLRAITRASKQKHFALKELEELLALDNEDE